MINGKSKQYSFIFKNLVTAAALRDSPVVPGGLNFENLKLTGPGKDTTSLQEALSGRTDVPARAFAISSASVGPLAFMHHMPRRNAIADGADPANMIFESMRKKKTLGNGVEDKEAKKQKEAALKNAAKERKIAAEKAKKEALKAKKEYIKLFEEKMVKWEDIDISFDDFPEYLSEQLQKLLITSLHIFLVRPDFVKYTKELGNISRRLLLCGQPGTDLYQEKLFKALGKHFKANLLILETSSFIQDGKAPPKKAPSPPVSLDGRAEALFQVAMEARPFRVGDKVKYTGPSQTPSLGLPRQISISEKKDKSGPALGATGKIVLTFDDPRRVGVRFDKPFAGGVNLGGECESGRGYFMDQSELKHEDEIEEGADSIAIEALFSVLLANKDQPCILLIKNIEKTLLPNHRHVQFKRALENIKDEKLVVIGTNTSADSSMRPPYHVLFSKGSSSHTTLVDLSFFDHISQRLEERHRESNKTSKLVTELFPTRVTIYPPQDADQLSRWDKMIDRDKAEIKYRQNVKALHKILKGTKVSCTAKPKHEHLSKKTLGTSSLEKVVGWAISHTVMNAGDQDMVIDDGLNIKGDSVNYALKMLEQEKPQKKKKSIYDVETDNEFEKKLVNEVIPPNEIEVKFSDIGALDKVKSTLKELVMLPLQRPELFRRGNLTKPCKGILMFGPPGTGKTMLAKAVATESGANFISISMASIGSKWFGEGEKYARAVFTLARKLSPCVIFVDEIDSILGRRDKQGEHEAMRKIKNEFMMMWDGLKSKENERVLVLGATNRPFDLDDAVLRRMPRRLLVDLPDIENRRKIFEVVLRAEVVEKDLDYEELAKMTEGYSGSDIRNLCVAAAYQPIREIMKRETKKMAAEAAKKKAAKEAKKAKDEASKTEKKSSKKEGKEEVEPVVDKKDKKDCKEGEDKDKTDKSSSVSAMDIDGEGVDKSDDKSDDKGDEMRALTLADFVKAKNEVSSSVSEDAVSISELRKWNELYGEGGNRKKSHLPYYT
eukprot:CAMPEP_0168536988 /NCGR_PEP_ID=MMETSP0405-20121227/19995_1 /TAXON_ID=498012 /ORGANISM="Trichosphaerium sp, Strain Am-I-7 wt" /LENGTH=1003 /DNA_ID=CAMNT_0008565335 /DNA_START=399 /DNA_END=3410 /DNA_ORIENTATION=+